MRHAWCWTGILRFQEGTGSAGVMVLRRRNHEVRLSSMVSEGGRGRPLSCGSTDGDYPVLAIRQPSVASGSGVQGVGRAKLGGGKSGPLDDVLKQGGRRTAAVYVIACGSWGTSDGVNVSQSVLNFFPDHSS